MSLLIRAPYLSLSCVTVDAMHQSACNADYQHLQEPDLLWTGAILADHAQKDCQSQALRDRDFLLDLTIEMGLYDNEAANTFLEKLMWYTAMSSSLLYDHVVALECQGTWCWGDYPVRPRGNPQPLGILLLIYSNTY